jgi:spermidine synthase
VQWRADVRQPVKFGTAELVPDAGHPGGWTLLIDGVQQSYVDLDDPTRLRFEYCRRVATVVDTAAPLGTPLRVLHLGGGALTLPRYVAVTRPGSPQRVVERDRDLDDLVRRTLPLPDHADVRTAAGDARTAVEAMESGRFDLVINDVYVGDQMPTSVASVQFVRQIFRVLVANGTYTVNVADLPPLIFTRILAATLREVFADVCAIGEPDMLRGRRYGNLVLVAGSALPIARLARLAARDEKHGQLLHADLLTAWIGGVGPMTDAEAG